MGVVLEAGGELSHVLLTGDVKQGLRTDLSLSSREVTGHLDRSCFRKVLEIKPD